jgi:SH3-like domain-containing protein
MLARNEANTWVQVRAPNGALGWVSAPLLQTSVPIAGLPLAAGTGSGSDGSGPTATLSNAAYVLNVRSGPGINFESVAKIQRGEQVRLLGRNAASSWIKVQLADGRQGWASGAYLMSSTPFAGLPIVSG